MVKDKFEEGFEKPESNFVSWGKVGDRIKGQLLSTREVEDKKFGGVQTIYELKGIEGYYHSNEDLVKTEVVAGDVYNVGTKKDVIKNQMRRAAIGQLVIFKFTEKRKTSMGAGKDAKIIEVLLGAIEAVAEVTMDDVSKMKF